MVAGGWEGMSGRKPRNIIMKGEVLSQYGPMKVERPATNKLFSGRQFLGSDEVQGRYNYGQR
jgi:hypothetical protein